MLAVLEEGKPDLLKSTTYISAVYLTLSVILNEDKVEAMHEQVSIMLTFKSTSAQLNCESFS